ncbi:N-formylglutamate amidohydrolase [compost metagenome]
MARNDPYKGVQLIAKIGQPALQRHSMQIEIRRPIYMDEASRERNANFDVVRNDITGLLKAMGAYFAAHPSQA